MEPRNAQRTTGLGVTLWTLCVAGVLFGFAAAFTPFGSLALLLAVCFAGLALTVGRRRIPADRVHRPYEHH